MLHHMLWCLLCLLCLALLPLRSDAQRIAHGNADPPIPHVQSQNTLHHLSCAFRT